jgi:hypothetical protein
MDDVEFLLTDEYMQYMKDIADIHVVKKDKEEEMKRLVDEYREEMSNLEEQAKTRHLEWENWKKEASGTGVDE